MCSNCGPPRRETGPTGAGESSGAAAEIGELHGELSSAEGICRPLRAIATPSARPSPCQQPRTAPWCVRRCLGEARRRNGQAMGCFGRARAAGRVERGTTRAACDALMLDQNKARATWTVIPNPAACETSATGTTAPRPTANLLDPQRASHSISPPPHYCNWRIFTLLHSSHSKLATL